MAKLPAEASVELGDEEEINGESRLINKDEGLERRVSKNELPEPFGRGDIGGDNGLTVPSLGTGTKDRLTCSITLSQWAMHAGVNSSHRSLPSCIWMLICLA